MGEPGARGGERLGWPSGQGSDSRSYADKFGRDPKSHGEM